MEAEKLTLTEQLERALQDPAKGCSIAIRKKLEQVEQTLIRTRIEAKKQQQLYRKAEQETNSSSSMSLQMTFQRTFSHFRQRLSSSLNVEHYNDLQQLLKEDFEALILKHKKDNRLLSKKYSNNWFVSVEEALAISFKTTIKLSFSSFDYCIEHELGVQFPLALTY